MSSKFNTCIKGFLIVVMKYDRDEWRLKIRYQLIWSVPVGQFNNVHYQKRRKLTYINKLCDKEKKL